MMQSTERISTFQLYRCIDGDLLAYYPIPSFPIRIRTVIISNNTILEGARLEIQSRIDQQKCTLNFQENRCDVTKIKDYIYYPHINRNNNWYLRLDPILIRIYLSSDECCPESINVDVQYDIQDKDVLMWLEKIPNSDEYGYRLPKLEDPIFQLTYPTYDKHICIHIGDCKLEMECCHTGDESYSFIDAIMISSAAIDSPNFAKHLGERYRRHVLFTNRDPVYISFREIEPLYIWIHITKYNR